MSKKILLVSTSATEMGGNPSGLWIAELAEPYYAFKAAGYDITIASPQGGACPIDAGSMKGDALTADSKKFMHDAEAFGALSHSAKLDAAMTGFDCVYLCGGHGCCVDFAGEKATALVSIVVSGLCFPLLLSLLCLLQVFPCSDPFFPPLPTIERTLRRRQSHCRRLPRSLRPH